MALANRPPAHPDAGGRDRTRGGARPTAGMLAMGAGFVALAVYAVTLAPDLTFAHYGVDGGELITASATLGVAHPPGYPTYLLLGRLFSFLPFGSIAFRYNLFSAVAAAVAAGFVTATIVWRPDGARPSAREAAAGLAGGLAFAFAPLVWSQAIIAETYALNLAAVALLGYLLVSGRGRTRPLLVGVVLGLAVTAHLTSLLLVPLALMMVPRAGWLRLAVGFAGGLLPFLLLPVLARDGSPHVWGDPRTLEGWWWLVSAALYRPNVFGLPAADWLPRAGQWSRALMTHFTVFGVPLIAVGAWLLYRERPRLAIGLLGTAALYGLYALGYRTADASRHFLPGLLLLTLVLGAGLRPVGWPALLLPLLMVPLNLTAISLHDADPLRERVESLLAQLPRGAIAVSPGDATISALWYFHFVERQRPDVHVVDANMYQFDWYRTRLSSHYPDLIAVPGDDLDAFLEENSALARCRVSVGEPTVDCIDAGQAE